jgi:glycosyltransferase involved in cell wall biosynthesis
VIAISNFIAEHVIVTYGADPERLRVIPRGVDLGYFDPAAVGVERIVKLARRWRLEDGAPVIMLPGRLTPWKGHGVMIDALAQLQDSAAIAVIVGGEEGTEPYQAELIARAVRLGVGERMRLVGRCEDMAAAYMLADVVVSASIRPEAFGRVAVEAQAMGVPVVATSIGAVHETVMGGVSGWLVPPGDPVALARALEAALALEPRQRKAQAEAARRHVNDQFALELMCERTLAVYREVLDAAAKA